MNEALFESQYQIIVSLKRSINFADFEYCKSLSSDIFFNFFLKYTIIIGTKYQSILTRTDTIETKNIILYTYYYININLSQKI